MTGTHVNELAVAMAKGWRIETDCGPCVRAVQDCYEPHQATEWLYPDAVGEPRYVEPSRFEEVVTRMIPLVLRSVGLCTSELGEEADDMKTNLKGATLEPIRFYKTAWPWGHLGNFSRHPIVVDSLEWPTTEHYFQAQKFVRTDVSYVEEIRSATKAAVAATMGRDRGHPLDPAWEDVKYQVMLVALVAKFTQHPDCRAMLLASGDRYLIEDTGQGSDDDHIWGDGSTGAGQNLLGKALMTVRGALQAGRVEGRDGLEHVTREMVRVSYEKIPPA